MSQKLYLNEIEAAAYLGLAQKTVSRWRWSGQGPSYVKFGGAVRYPVAALEAYASSRAVVPGSVK